MKNIIFSFAIFCIGSRINSQIKIEVNDSITHKGLTFATIKSLKNNYGLYTDVNGLATIEMFPNDSLEVSYVGYSTKKCSFENLITKNKVELAPITFELKEIIVKNNIAIGEPLNIGYLNNSKDIKSELAYSVEFAVKIYFLQHYKDVKLLKIIVKGVEKNERNNSLRLHLYDNNKGFPGNELLTDDKRVDNLLISKNKNLEIDISKMNITNKDSILFVGIESIGSSIETGKKDILKFNRGVYFTNQLSESLTYTRTLKYPNWIPFIVIANPKISNNPLNLIAGLEVQPLKE